MSIVSSYTTPEAAAALKRQRKAATFSSLLISILVIVLIGVILAIILLPSLIVESTPLVTYQAAKVEEEQPDRPEMNPQVKRKPSAPSAAMSKVIASTTPSPTAVPVPDVVDPVPSPDFGDGDDFGAGWGSGDGAGGGGGATFFGQKVSAERIAYVIDYSASMRGEREKLMRKELTDSVNQITDGTNYALIFFAGPAWVAGDEVQMNKAQGTAVVKGDGGHKFAWRGQGASKWEHDGRKQPVDWLVATGAQINKSKKVIEESGLVWGTVWDNPLQMALEMDPIPQVIYFMTDGAASGSAKWAADIGALAKKEGVTINCIAMMQPKAHKDMEELAKLTKGQFTIVNQGGKREKVR